MTDAELLEAEGVLNELHMERIAAENKLCDVCREWMNQLLRVEAENRERQLRDLVKARLADRLAAAGRREAAP